jgi:hypothetical protein
VFLKTYAMKKICFGLFLFVSAGATAQIAYFPTVDSLRKFQNKHIRNSAIDAFTNLRLNTTLNGIAQFLDSARLVWSGGGGGGANNYPTSLSLATDGTLTLGRNALGSLTTSITTSKVAEAGGIQYFTTARARQSIVNGYGWNYNNTTGVGSLDSSVLGSISLVKKTGYDTAAKIVGNRVYLKPIKLSIGNGNGTAVDLSDDSSIHWQINPTGSGGSSTLDATLATGNTTTRQVVQQQSTGPESFLGWMGQPSNYGTVYSGIPAQRFTGLGWARFDGVNADGRPNVVLTIAGYNHNTGGGRDNSSEASFGFRAETHYQLAGLGSFEFHMPEITTAGGTTIRPFSMYTRKSSGYTEMNMAVPSVSYIDYQNSARTWMSFSDGATQSAISLQPQSGGAGSIATFIMGGSSGSSGTNHDFTITNDGQTTTFNHNGTTALLSIGMRASIGGGGTAGSNYKALSMFGWTTLDMSEIDNTPLVVNKGAGGADIVTLQEGGASRYLLNPAYMRIAMNAPKLQFYNASGGTDAKMWIHEVSGNDEYFRTYDDGVSSSVDILRFNRTGTTVNYVAIPNTELYIGSTTDQGAYSLQNTGNLYNGGNYYAVKHYTSLQSLTSSTAGSGAGTGPTLTVTGGDVSGKIVLATGTSPASAGNLVVVTFLNAYGIAPSVVITPGSSSAAALSGTSSPLRVQRFNNAIHFHGGIYGPCGEYFLYVVLSCFTLKKIYETALYFNASH